MLNKALIGIVMLTVVFGCANQQPEVEVEEISLTVTGMVCSSWTGKVQAALTKVAGVTEIVSISSTENKVVVMVEKDKVKTTTLIDAVEAIEEVDEEPRFTAQLFDE